MGAWGLQTGEGVGTGLPCLDSLLGHGCLGDGELSPVGYSSDESEALPHWPHRTECSLQPQE